jgi:hypothetical protein
MIQMASFHAASPVDGQTPLSARQVISIRLVWLTVAGAMLCVPVAQACAQSGYPRFDSLATNDRLYLVPGYVALARDLKSPVPCFRISDTASWSAAMDGRTGYYKSECFDELAQASGNVSWCRNVRPRWSLFLSGRNYTPAKCIERVRASGPKGQVAYAGQEPLLRVLGCREEDIISALGVDPGLRTVAPMTGFWIDLYYQLIASGDLQKHLADLPDFSAHAVHAPPADPDWCRRLDRAALRAAQKRPSPR